MATKQAKFRCVAVIPAKAGIQEIRHVIDSGSPLRYGRHDIFNCRVNIIGSYSSEWLMWAGLSKGFFSSPHLALSGRIAFDFPKI